MQKLKLIILSFILLFSTLVPKTGYAAIDPKAKAFLMVCAYGTVGGALLGFASLSFGTNQRAIAQGASLGLYAGIIFGAYVLSSHKTAEEQMEEMRRMQEQPSLPPEGSGPSMFSPGGWGAPTPQPSRPSGGGGGFFGGDERVRDVYDSTGDNFQDFRSKKPRGLPPVTINLLNVIF